MISFVCFSHNVVSRYSASLFHQAAFCDEELVWRVNGKLLAAYFGR